MGARHIVPRGWVWAVLVTAACGPGGPPGPVDAGPGPDGPLTEERLYDADHVLTVSLTLRDGDWDALRHTAHHSLDVLGDSCEQSPPPNPYAYLPADLVIDGVRVAQVGVRKKGFFGSQSTDRPSLKIKLNEYVAGQALDGVTHLTLNNNLADPSQVRQCIGYHIAFAAGLPAPRCTLAAVTVNQQWRGLYSHIEPIRGPFLQRVFGEDQGALFEGALSDFRPGWVNTFEGKTAPAEADRAALLAVLAALPAPGEGGGDEAALLEALGEVIDLEQFYTFWAWEVLVLHGDGYARSMNNFYVYRPAGSDRLVFFPWGIDSILAPDRAFLAEDAPPPPATWVQAALARRLYETEAGRAGFAAALRALLDEVWDEDRWRAEVDRHQARIEPYLSSWPAGEQALVRDSLDEVRAFIDGRRAVLTAALDALPDIAQDQLQTVCLAPTGTLSLLLGDDAAWADVSLEADALSAAEAVVSEGGGLVVLAFVDRPWTLELPQAELQAGTVWPGHATLRDDDGDVLAAFGGGDVTVSAAGLRLAGHLYPP